MHPDPRSVVRAVRRAFFALLCLTAWTSCSSRDAHADTGPVVSTARVESTATPNSDCWWCSEDPDSLTAVWVGPRLQGEIEAGFRFVTLFHHDPGLDGSAAMFAGVAALDGASPVKVANGSVSLRATPIDGHTWRDVLHRDHLDVTLERLP